jgi:hypothetical protein
MEKNILVDSDKMYRLFEDNTGALRLGVMAGGFAMYEITFPLSDAEIEEYQVRGKDYLDRLSMEAAKNPEAFKR